MSSVARKRNPTELHEVLTAAEALAVLQAMVRSERPCDTDFVMRADELLRALPDESASSDLVQGLLDVQHLYHLQLLGRNAIPAGVRAIRWARTIGDEALLAKALTYRGAVASGSHDISTALEMALESLRIGIKIGDLLRVTFCYLNLCATMCALGRYRAAVACAEASVELSEKLNRERLGMRGISLNQLSAIHLNQQDWRAALRVSRMAQQVLIQSAAAKESTGMNCSYLACAVQNEVTALVYLNELEQASEVIDRLAAVAQQYPSEQIQSFLQTAVALHEGFAGNLLGADYTLRNIMHRPTVREDALRALISICERGGETEKALDLTRELLDDLRTARREVTEADIAQISISVPGDDDGVIRELTTRAAGFERLVDKIGDKFQAKLAYLFELAANAELSEEDVQFSGEHIYRVGRLCASLAAEASCGDEMCWLAEIAGRAHDVGKTSVPSLIIQKIVPLNDGERDILRSHAEDGAALIAQLAEPRLVQVVAAVRHHHERWDGTGYPSRLKEEETPLLSRIVSLCDSFDSMTHCRPFRPARSIASGLQEVERCAGSQFDPRLAGLFVNLVRKLQREHGDLDEYLGEPARRTRWAKSHPELMRLLEARRTTL